MTEVIQDIRLDRSEKQIIAATWQDVEDIIETNKRLQATPQDRKAIWRHTASIPNNIINQWLTEEWKRGNVGLKFLSDEFNKLVQRKLQDPDWRWLRTDK